MKSLPRSLLETVLHGLPEGVLVADRQGGQWRAVFYNRAFRELSGLAAGELSGQSLESVFGVLGAADEWRRAAAALADREPFHATLYPGTPDEPASPLSLAVTALDSTDGGDYAACHLSLRTREARAADGPPSPVEGLPAAERRDAATGLVPREFFDGVVVHDWAVAQREGHRLSLLVYRIEAFPAYLDTFGRHATESMVRRVARAITRRLRRASDLASRLEEDCIVALVHGGDETGVIAFADSISDQVRALGIHHPHSPVGRFVTVRCSVHGALPAPDTDPSDLVMEALAATAEL